MVKGKYLAQSSRYYRRAKTANVRTALSSKRNRRLETAIVEFCADRKLSANLTTSDTTALMASHAVTFATIILQE